MDHQDQQDKINFPESIKPDETTGSVSSDRKIMVKIKHPKLPPEMAAAITWAEETKSHNCKECNKCFSSGKALGGHMSSAHVQANKDYSDKKLKPRTAPKSQFRASGSGVEEDRNACAVCGKRFPSQKSLYGHMRCHPDRDWRGMEPPVGPRVDSSEASTEPGLEYAAPDQEADGGDDVGLGQGPAVFLDRLKGWPVKAKRGRLARPGTVSPTGAKCPSPVSISEEMEAVSGGHQLLRLLKRNLDSSEKIAGEADRATGSDPVARRVPESSDVFSLMKQLLARHGPEREDRVDSREIKKDYYCPVKKPALGCGMDANHGPEAGTGERDQARDSKKRRMNPRTPRVKIWDSVMFDGKGKEKAVDPSDHGKKPAETESEDDLYLGAISVLVNGKRETHHQKPILESSAQTKVTTTEVLTPAQQKDDNSVLPTSPEKHICSTCKKVFPSHQALGGHRSSHNKFKINIINSIDNINNNNLEVTKTKAENNIKRRQQKQRDDDDSSHVCGICSKSFATARALGGHKKCHNSGSHIGDGDIDSNSSNNNNKGDHEERVVRGFDLNMMPTENGNEDLSADKSEL